ncbi:MAG: hypothetical protein AAF907_05900, partial [Planctomycetota bacterium]
MADDDYRFESGWAEPRLPTGSVEAPAGVAEPSPGRNLLLDPQPIEYAYERTPLGVWKRHVGVDGKSFAEFVSHGSLGRLPWLHMTFGKDPATRRLKTAKGVFAVGR